jgi:hypothetical protein
MSLLGVMAEPPEAAASRMPISRRTRGECHGDRWPRVEGFVADGFQPYTGASLTEAWYTGPTVLLCKE